MIFYKSTMFYCYASFGTAPLLISIVCVHLHNSSFFLNSHSKSACEEQLVDISHVKWWIVCVPRSYLQLSITYCWAVITKTRAKSISEHPHIYCMQAETHILVHKITLDKVPEINHFHCEMWVIRIRTSLPGITQKTFFFCILNRNNTASLPLH